MGKKEKLIMNAALLYKEKVLACAQALRLSQEHNISLKERWVRPATARHQDD
jgi:hypothetical protein